MMGDAEILNLIEHHKWRIQPLLYGGWCIDALDENGMFVRLCLTHETSLREAIQQAMRRQNKLGIERNRD